MAIVERLPAESRVLLHNVDWDTYERLLASHADSSSPRFVYDRGELEIMSPLPQHEKLTWAAERLVEEAAQALGLEWVNLRTTTFRRRDLRRGFEPDSCFYIANESLVRGKGRIDLATDPPPDLVIEVDITHSSVDKLGVYGEFGVPEVWRYDGERFELLALESARYIEVDRSGALAGVSATDVARLLEESKGMGNTAWLRRVREWARELSMGSRK